MSDLLIWKAKKSLWNKARKASDRSVMVIPATKTLAAVVTNGHFAVSVGRALVKECEAKAGTTFERIGAGARKSLPTKLPKSRRRIYQRTRILISGSKGADHCRVYRDQDGGALTTYNDAYLEFLGHPETLYAQKAESVALDNPNGASFWICPVVIGAKDAELAQQVLNGPEPTATVPTAKPEPVTKPVPVPEPTTEKPVAVSDDAARVAVGAEVRRSGSWLWARFPSRPSAEIREQMRSAGWHWSRRRQEWYLRPAKVAA
ncbi:MAG: hypothetical protein GY719_36700 [bacterium]|nr:hypothetical protein [bacterium]